MGQAESARTVERLMVRVAVCESDPRVAVMLAVVGVVTAVVVILNGAER